MGKRGRETKETAATGERDRQTDRQTDRQRQTETDREGRGREGEIERQSLEENKNKQIMDELSYLGLKELKSRLPS